MPCHGVAMTTTTFRRKLRAHRNLPPPAERRAIRIASGVTQEDIAGEVGRTRAAVSRWESGERAPRGADLVAYAELLQRLKSTE